MIHCETSAVAPIVFGCEQLGGYEWGCVDEKEIHSAIEVALENGVRLFDTADCYGKGHSETQLGILKSSRHREMQIATKGGVRFGSKGVFYDNSRTYLEAALDASLARLKSENIALYQVHHWDRSTPVHEICDSLEALVKKGKIKSYGLCNIPDIPSELAEFPNLKSVSHELSLANRAHQRAANDAMKQGLFFLPYGVLGQGILTGKYTKESDFPENDRRVREEYGNFHGSRLERNLAIVDVLKRWSTRLGFPISSLALAWVRSINESVWPLVGIKKTSQILEAIAGLKVELPHELLAELNEVSRPIAIGETC